MLSYSLLPPGGGLLPPAVVQRPQDSAAATHPAPAGELLSLSEAPGQHAVPRRAGRL